MELTWQDIRNIVKAADQIVDEDEDGKLITIGEQGYYQIVLDRWRENTESKGGGAITVNMKDLARHFFELGQKK